MGVDYLDIMLCHDIEFVDMSQIVDETLPALRRFKEQGKVRFIGISGYPMKIFRYVLERTDLDVVLSYNHYTLQNTMLADLVPYLKAKGVGIMNAAPFSARLLTNAAAAALAQGDARGSRASPAGGRALRGPRASTSPSSRCSSRSPTRTWPPASSARPTRRTSGSGSSGPTRRSISDLLAEVLEILGRSTTGSTSKAGRKTTIRRGTLKSDVRRSERREATP